MSPAVVKEKAKSEKRKKVVQEKENGKEVTAPPSKQVKQDAPAKPEKKIEKPVAPKKVDVYKEILSLELRESAERSISDDDRLFKEICNELRSLLGDLYTLKLGKGDKPKAEIKEKRIEAGLLFVKMKKLNRLEKLRIRSAREMTNSAKQKVDEFNLQLQNLRYEVLHLKKEVNRCINFWSADERVEMVNVDTFYREAPEDVSKPDTTKDNPHEQRLARLAWELKTRQTLDNEAQDLEDVKNIHDTVVSSKEEKVKELARHLNTILKATRPVQESLNLNLDAERAQTSVSAYLPDPLYILFSQADAYSRGLDPFLSVDITGDQAKAKDWGSNEKGEEEEDARTRMFKAHPLSVTLSIKTKAEVGDSVDVSFFYLPELGIVTVQGRTHLTNQTYAGEVLEVGSILSQLYEGDEGLHSPNLKNEYQLKEAGISGDVGKLIRESGSPFVWAQRLAGLNFLSSAGPDKSISFMHMQTTVQAIRKRLVSRVSLQSQLNHLEQGKGLKLDAIPQTIIDKFPLKVSSRLKSWAPVTWEKFKSHEESSSVASNGAVDSSDFLYKAVLNRGVAALTVLVSLRPDYPASNPVFCLSLLWKDKWTAANNEWIRDLEKEMNGGVVDADRDDFLLTHQVYKLLVLFDVLLESVSALDPEPLFTREKDFKNPVEGRQRKLPLIFNSGDNIFTQH